MSVKVILTSAPSAVRQGPMGTRHVYSGIYMVRFYWSSSYCTLCSAARTNGSKPRGQWHIRGALLLVIAALPFMQYNRGSLALQAVDPLPYCTFCSAREDQWEHATCTVVRSHGSSPHCTFCSTAEDTPPLLYMQNFVNSQIHFKTHLLIYSLVYLRF